MEDCLKCQVSPPRETSSKPKTKTC